MTKGSMIKSLVPVSFAVVLVAFLNNCGGTTPATKASQRQAPQGANQVGVGTCPTAQLNLAATPNYTDTIQAFLAAKCVTCHTVTKPLLNTYAAAVAGAQASLADIQSGKMPIGSTLSATEKAAFAAWVAAGTPQSAAAATPIVTPSVDPGAGAGTGSSAGTSNGSGSGSGSTAAVTPSAPPAAATPATCVPANGGVQPGSTAVPVSAGGAPQAPVTAPAPAYTPAPAPQPTNAPASVLPAPTTPAPTTPAPTTPAPTTPAPAITYTNTIQAYLSGHCAGCHGGTSPRLDTYANAKANAASAYSSMVAKRMPKGGAAASATELANFQAWITAGEPQ